MRVLLDTNIVLDVLVARAPHAESAVRVLAAVESGLVTGVISATSVTTVFYCATKAVGARRAKGHVRTILSLCEVAPVTDVVLTHALDLRLSDFEDAGIHEAARGSRCDGIVTRDARGFKGAALPIYSPTEMLAVVQTRSLTGNGLPNNLVKARRGTEVTDPATYGCGTSSTQSDAAQEPTAA